MSRMIAGGLALALIAGPLAPSQALELPRRFAAAEIALEVQFTERSAPRARPAPIRSAAKVEKKRSRARLYLSAVLTAGVGIAAYWSKERADAAYERYLHSANVAQQNELYDKARRFDRLAGAAYFGMEAGVVLSSYLLFFAR
ncbi:MAG: hypothetical protein VX293_04360 [Candidatus Latescibacterota bacterium]|nr:hypothetical protein [Candidatus Latescibacterota bacterium]